MSKKSFFGRKVRKQNPMTSTALDFLLGSNEACYAALQFTTIMQTWTCMRNKNTECVVVRVMVSSAAFFSPLLPVATLVTTNKPRLPLHPLMSHSGCVHENLKNCGDNSLGFVHDTEGEGKASSNFLKLSLRNEAVLVVIVVFEHRLWERRGHVVTLVFRQQQLQEPRRVVHKVKGSLVRQRLHLRPPFSAHVCWWCGGQAEGQLLTPSPQTLEA